MTSFQPCFYAYCIARVRSPSDSLSGRSSTCGCRERPNHWGKIGVLHFAPRLRSATLSEREEHLNEPEAPHPVLKASTNVIDLDLKRLEIATRERPRSSTRRCTATSRRPGARSSPCTRAHSPTPREHASGREYAITGRLILDEPWPSKPPPPRARTGEGAWGCGLFASPTGFGEHATAVLRAFRRALRLQPRGALLIAARGHAAVQHRAMTGWHEGTKLDSCSAATPTTTHARYSSLFSARLGPSERERIAAEMSEDVRRIAIEGELRRPPELSEAEARQAVLDRLWGAELAAAVRRARAGRDGQ